MNLEEIMSACNRGDKKALIDELLRRYSVAYPGIGGCHPYGEIRSGKTSQALEHLKKTDPDGYKYIADLVARDKENGVGWNGEHVNVTIHEVKIGDKYLAKSKFVHGLETYPEGTVFGVHEVNLETGEIMLKVEVVTQTKECLTVTVKEPPIYMTYERLCELTRDVILLKRVEHPTPLPKVTVNHVTVGDKYVAKEEFRIETSFIVVTPGDVLEVVSMDTDTHLITFKCENVPSQMLFSKFCELTEKGILVKKED